MKVGHSLQSGLTINDIALCVTTISTFISVLVLLLASTQTMLKIILCSVEGDAAQSSQVLLLDLTEQHT